MSGQFLLNFYFWSQTESLVLGYYCVMGISNMEKVDVGHPGPRIKVQGVSEGGSDGILAHWIISCNHPGKTAIYCTIVHILHVLCHFWPFSAIENYFWFSNSTSDECLPCCQWLLTEAIRVHFGHISMLCCHFWVHNSG